MKVVLTGNFGVGKTSLFNQFVHQRFSDTYKMTIGVRVEKKTIVSYGKEVKILLWDIEGQIHQQKIPTSYFLGANTILYIFDLARPSTLQELSNNISYLKQLVPNVDVKLIANKCDLIGDKEIYQIQQSIPYPIDLITSAKSNKNVDALFEQVASSILINT